EHGVTLQLQQLQGEDRLFRIKPPRGVLLEEAANGLRIALVEHPDVVVARFPGVAEQLGRTALVGHRQGVAEPVERVAERSAPALAPARVPAGVAATVTPPPLDPVDAAPGAVLDD